MYDNYSFEEEITIKLTWVLFVEYLLLKNKLFHNLCMYDFSFAINEL